MADLFTTICGEASRLINSKNFIERNKTNDNAFIRNRKIGFSVIMCFILNLLTRTLQIELDDFIDRVLAKPELSVTKQAFSKARKNIKWQAFEELFLVSRNIVLNSCAIKRYKGFRIFAVDGSEIRFDKTAETEKLFGKRSNDVASKCRAKISTLTDVISGFIVAAKIDSIHSSERKLAKEHFSEFKDFCTNKDILIFDRGYLSREMVAELSEMGCKYLMRVQKSSFKEINEAKADDCYIKILYKNKLYKVRLIRFLLPSGETEVLITNLGRKSFKKDDFMKLYSMRWGIETKYNTIKNKILVERFSGRSVLSIKQEFFAAIFMCNCAAAVSLNAEEKITLKKQNCKYDYKPNMNLIIGYLKHRFPRILLSSAVETLINLCEEIFRLALKQPVPIKPDRHFERPNENHHRKAGRPKYSI